MRLLANTRALLGKELRTEFRSRELLTTTVVFILIVIVLFSFTFDPTSDESRRFAPGLLWLAFFFAASLMLQPCFLREQHNDTLSALRLSVSDPFAIFLAKLLANTLFLLLTELFLLPFFSIMYNVPVMPVLALARAGIFSREPGHFHCWHGALRHFRAGSHARAIAAIAHAAALDAGSRGQHGSYEEPF